mgnify:CR=1 FL=1
MLYKNKATERKLPVAIVLVKFWAFADLLCFLFVLEAAFGLLEAHAGIHMFQRKISQWRHV